MTANTDNTSSQSTQTPAADSQEEPVSNLERALASNKKSILDALASMGVTRIVLSYSGEGDSGGSLEINEVHGGELLNWHEPVVLTVVSTVYDSEIQQKRPNTIEQKFTLWDGLDNLLDQLHEMHGHTDFEIGEGGGGELVLLVEEGQVHLEHYDNVVAKETHNYCF